MFLLSPHFAYLKKKQAIMFHKIIFTGILLAISFQPVSAQPYNKLMDGEWELQSTTFLRSLTIEAGEVTHYHRQESTDLWKSVEESGNTKIKSLLYDNNISSTFIEKLNNPAQTRTYSFNLSFISPYVLFGFYYEFFNNLKETEYISDDPGFVYNEIRGSQTFARTHAALFPKKTKTFSLSSSMASTSEYIKLEKVFNTVNSTVLKFSLKNNTSTAQNVSLHPPGSQKAYFISTGEGKKYKMVDQYGFGKYKTITLKKNSKKRYFYVFTEKIPDNTETITIREGNCSTGCWNFYDVKLN